MMPSDASSSLPQAAAKRLSAISDDAIIFDFLRMYFPPRNRQAICPADGVLIVVHRRVALGKLWGGKLWGGFYCC